MPVKRKPGDESHGFVADKPDIPEELLARAGKITKAEWVELFREFYHGTVTPLYSDGWICVAEDMIKAMRKEKRAERKAEGSKP